MRPVKELADVATKLETLEDLVQNLQDIIVDITDTIKKCSAWVDEADNTTYQDIKQMLVSKTCQYIQQLFQIAFERNNTLSEHAITDEQMKTISQMETLGSDIKESLDYKKLGEKLKEITVSVKSQSERIDILQERNESLVKEKLKEITANVESQSERIDTLQERNKSLVQKKLKEITTSVKTQSDIATILEEKNTILEKATKKLSKQNQVTKKICEEHYKEIMAELSVASCFMSNLKDENINLSMNLTEHNIKIEDLSEKVYKEIEIILEFMQQSDNSKESVEKLQEENANYQSSLETIECENKKLREELGIIPERVIKTFERSMIDVRKKNIHFLLLGCSGSGKSSLGNSILQRECFKVGHSLKKVHTKLQCEIGEFNGRGIEVFELPDIYYGNHGKQSKDSFQETKDKISQCSHGFPVILLVLRFGCRITYENSMLIEDIKTTFGQNFIKKYGIIVMTHGDCWKLDFEDKKFFRHWIQRQRHFRAILTECNGRALLFDNRSHVKDEQTEQLQTLENMVDKLILSRTFQIRTFKCT